MCKPNKNTSHWGINSQSQFLCSLLPPPPEHTLLCSNPTVIWSIPNRCALITFFVSLDDEHLCQSNRRHARMDFLSPLLIRRNPCVCINHISNAKTWQIRDFPTRSQSTSTSLRTHRPGPAASKPASRLRPSNRR